MNDHATHSGDDEANRGSDAPIDWYGQTDRKRKNRRAYVSDQIATKTLIVAVAVFIMSVALVVAAIAFVRLSTTPQVLLVVTATPQPYPNISVRVTAASATATILYTNTVPPSWTPAPTLNNDGLAIQITIRERAPLRIALDNRVVYIGVPVPNIVLNFQANTSIYIHTGDAGGIDVVINGVQQPPLGPQHAIVDKMYTTAGIWIISTLSVPTATLTVMPTATMPLTCATFLADSSLPKIVYETDAAGGWNIYVTDPDGNLKCRVTQPGSPTANHAYQPAWSLDGKHIVFVSDRANGFQLYTMNADGSNQQPLSNNNVQNYRPNWSPDGKRIAFVEQIDKTVFELHVINADGTNPRLLINDSRASYPAWSPDGSKLVYDSLHNGEDWFYIADGSGNNPVKLFDNGASASPSHIAWSPDGTRLVFESSRTGRPQIFIANADGSGLMQLTYSKGWNYNACWLPNNQIIFASTRDGHAVIYLMNDDGTEQHPITHDPFSISDDNPACSFVPPP